MKMSFLGRICIFLCFVLCDNTLFAQVTMNSIALKHNMTIDTVYAFYNINVWVDGSNYGFDNDIISGHIIFGQLNGEIKWSMYRFIMPNLNLPPLKFEGNILTYFSFFFRKPCIL